MICPTTAVAGGRWISEPADVETAVGRNLKPVRANACDSLTLPARAEAVGDGKQLGTFVYDDRLSDT